MFARVLEGVFLTCRDSGSYRRALRARVGGLGDLLRETERAKGTAGAGRPKLGGTGARPPKLDSPPTLAALGISKRESAEAQELAIIPRETFEAYCRERWGWHKAYCNHLIRAADTVKALPETVATIVATETQARELAKAEPESRPRVIEIAAETVPLFEKEAKERQREHGETAPGKKTLTEKIPEVFGESRAKAAEAFKTNRQYVSDAKAAVG